jgi:riboflavin synthase
VFTGIIEAVGTIRSVDTERGGKAVSVVHPPFERTLNEGDSIAVDGTCLTAEKVEKGSFRAFLSPETLRVSKFHAKLRSGLPVNLERALTLEKSLGGHLVQGHVDCTGTLRSIRPTGRSATWEFALSDPGFMKYIVRKGSLAVDGVSLTVKEKTREGFSVEFIPFTLEHTTFKDKRSGDLFNLEFDLIAKHVYEFVRSAEWR